MIIMSQEVNGKQKVSENNRPYATTATAKRFSCVPSMFDSLGVKVPYPTRWR